MVQARPGDGEPAPVEHDPSSDRAFIVLILSSGSKTLQDTRVLLLATPRPSAPDVFHGAESDVGLSDWGAAGRLLADSPEEQGAGPVLLGHAAGLATAGPIAGLAALTPPIVLAPRAPDRSPERPVARGRLGRLRRSQGAGWPATWIHPRGRRVFADIRRRVVPSSQELPVRHPGQTIIVVAHGVVIRVVLTEPSRGSRARRLRPLRHRLRLDQRPPLGRQVESARLNQSIAPSPAAAGRVRVSPPRTRSRRRFGSLARRRS